MNKLISSSLIFLFFLNIGDAFATHYWVTNGFAEELNPAMRVLLEFSPALFLLIKIVTGSICVWILWSRRDGKFVKVLTLPLLGVYLTILFLHLRILFQVL
jgi:hypothetical protein